MKIFLYEFVTGGGFLQLEGKPVPEGSLLQEGEAMWRAVYQDFARLEGVEVFSLRDARLPALSPIEFTGVTTVDHFATESFFGLATNCDACLLIAPEFDNVAVALTQKLEMLGRPLLSPNLEFVSIATDKTLTAERLAEAGIATPRGMRIDDSIPVLDDFPFPAVMKVNDGAGSMAEMVGDASKLAGRQFERVMRLEQYVQGTACSISFLCCGRESPIACPPMKQILSNDGHFKYLGGKRMTSQSDIERVTTLGTRTLAALPPTIGYVGIDLILGDGSAPDSMDYVIEVNPRLTTSYIGLREITSVNLAQAMVQCVSGERPSISFSNSNVHFTADGMIL